METRRTAANQSNDWWLEKNEDEELNRLYIPK